MLLREIMDEIRRQDAFQLFWTYPEERNLWKIYSKLGAYRTPRDIANAVRQVCALVFERNEEGTFLHTEAANLLRYTEKLIERISASAQHGLDGAHLLNAGHQDKDEGAKRSGAELDKVVDWEHMVTDVLARKYGETLKQFADDLGIPEIDEHVRIILYE